MSFYFEISLTTTWDYFLQLVVKTLNYYCLLLELFFITIFSLRSASRLTLWLGSFLRKKYMQITSGGVRVCKRHTMMKNLISYSSHSHEDMNWSERRLEIYRKCCSSCLLLFSSPWMQIKMKMFLFSWEISVSKHTIFYMWVMCWVGSCEKCTKSS